MRYASTEAWFIPAMSERGFRVVRPGDKDFVAWGFIDIGGGVLVNRWLGGSSLASQFAYLIKRKSECVGGPPPAASPDEGKRKTRFSKKKVARKKKGKKRNA